MRIREELWTQQHYKARWSADAPAPSWWVEFDLAWMKHRGERESIADTAARVGWNRRDVLRLQREIAIDDAGQFQEPDAGAESAPEDLPGHLTHADVVTRAVRWLRGYHHCSSAYAEIAIPGEPVFPDAIGFRGSWSILVEAKVSRSDFRADRDKVIHQSPSACPGQERWYLTPPNLVYPGEVPAGWGLAEVFARTVKIRLPAPVGEADPDRARADMRILTAVTRRHEVGAKWDHEAGRFAPIGVRT